MNAARLISLVGHRLTILFSVVAPLTLFGDEPLLERDVLPILTKNCMACHGGLRQQAGLDLRTLPGMLAGGESGPAMEPGNADKVVKLENKGLNYLTLEDSDSSFAEDLRD